MSLHLKCASMAVLAGVLALTTLAIATRSTVECIAKVWPARLRMEAEIKKNNGLSIDSSACTLQSQEFVICAKRKSLNSKNTLRVYGKSAHLQLKFAKNFTVKLAAEFCNL